MSLGKILFVVHRAYPFPGGSEYYVQNMAEEALKRGHQVAILAHEHMGDQNNIVISNDYQGMLNHPWDLIVVHGADVISQNIVHENADKLSQKVLYMIIKPSESEVALKGMEHHNFLGYSTKLDVEHIKKYGHLDKARKVRHGIVPQSDFDILGLNYVEYGLEDVKDGDKIVTSVGGFSPHKGMHALIEAFKEADIPDMHLCLAGYSHPELANDNDNVKNVHFFKGLSKEKIQYLIANSDAYVMNSYEEGFGLVLLEAMMHMVPWYARANVGAVPDLAKYGRPYDNERQLMNMLENIEGTCVDVAEAYKFVMANHTITQTVDDIEDIIRNG